MASVVVGLPEGVGTGTGGSYCEYYSAHLEAILYSTSSTRSSLDADQNALLISLFVTTGCSSPTR